MIDLNNLERLACAAIADDIGDPVEKLQRGITVRVGELLELVQRLRAAEAAVLASCGPGCSHEGERRADARSRNDAYWPVREAIEARSEGDAEEATK